MDNEQSRRSTSAVVGAKPARDEPPGPTVVHSPNALLASERAPRTLLQALVDAEPTPERGASYAGMLIDGRYVVESLIARGGMGVVYQCRHKVLGKRLAVKIIRADIAQLPEAPERFLIEAKAASAVGNEHIIDISDFGKLPDGSAYLVMELLEGVPLSALIGEHQTLPMPRILAIAMQAAEGLGAAHDAGIVHRDLKPENIFILQRKSADYVKILDFGIAKMPRPNAHPLTRAGTIVGTPHYMSPEQASGQSIDHRADIYALGVILYELAAGRVPFDGSHYMAVLTKHVTEPPPPFRLVPAPSVPLEFERIVLMCLAKRPEQRFQSMADLIQALQAFEQSLSSVWHDMSRARRPALDATRQAPENPPRSVVSVPAAASRSIITPPRRRAQGWAALGALLLTASLLSLWRLRSAPPERASDKPAQTEAPASTPLPVELEAAEPATVIELAPGKEVEVEARTRLSLRLKPEPSAAPRIEGLTRSGPRRRARTSATSRETPPQAERPAAPPTTDLLNPWPAEK